MASLLSSGPASKAPTAMWWKIGQHEPGFKLTVTVEADVTRYVVSAQLLQNGMEYEVSLGTLSGDGNASVGETCISLPNFSTAE